MKPGSAGIAAGLLALAAVLGACRQSADPACAGLTAASAAPTREAYRAMSPAERRAEAVRFNDLAQRCGWEP